MFLCSLSLHLLLGQGCLVNICFRDSRGITCPLISGISGWRYVFPFACQRVGVISPLVPLNGLSQNSQKNCQNKNLESAQMAVVACYASISDQSVISCWVTVVVYLIVKKLKHLDSVDFGSQLCSHGSFDTCSCLFMCVGVICLPETSGTKCAGLKAAERRWHKHTHGDEHRHS